MAVTANGPGVQEADIKGTIELVEGLYKVTYKHGGHNHTLGLFGTLDESHRVCDVLNIKEAVDTRSDLNLVRLHFDLGRYGVDNDTAGEIRSVSFRQVIRDLQVCAVKPLHPTQAEETQATSWAAVVNQATFTGGTVYHDAGERGGGAVSTQITRPTGSTASPLPGGQRPVAGLPPLNGRRATSRATGLVSVGPQPSAARNAFQAAGIANAAAAAVQGVDHSPASGEEGDHSPAGGGGAGAEAARAPPLPPPKSTERQEQQQQQQQQQAGEQRGRQGASQANGAAHGARRGQGQEAAGARKRARGEEGGMGPAESSGSGDEEESEPPPPSPAQQAQQQAQAQQAQQQQPRAVPKPAGDAAKRAAQGAAAKDRQEEEEEAEAAAEEGAAGRGTKGPPPASGQKRPGGPGGGRGRGRGRGVKRRKSTADGVPGERPWQEQDVMAFTGEEHPFHGITRDTAHGSSMAAQFVYYLLPDGQPSPNGKEKKSVRLAKCSTAAEAAVAWDLGALWRAIQYGQDPASLDADVEASQCLNFAFIRYKALLPTLRGIEDYPALQAQIKALRDNGTLARVAGGPAAPAAAGAAAGAAAIPAVVAPGADATVRAAAAAAAAAVPGSAKVTAGKAAAEKVAPTASPAVHGGSRPAASTLTAGGRLGSSGFKGVQGSGPWAAQISLKAEKMLPDARSQWTTMRAQEMLRVAGCTSPELGAACYDLMLIWRCGKYGEEASGAPLNFELPAYAPFEAELHAVDMANIVRHVIELRDCGALRKVATGRRRTPGSPAPAAAATAATSPPKLPRVPAFAGAGPALKRAPAPAAAAAAPASLQQKKTSAAAAAAAAAASPARAPAAAAVASPARAAKPQQRQAAAAPAPAAPVRHQPAPARAVARAQVPGQAGADQQVQEVQQLALAPLQQAAYRRDEAPQVQVQTAMFAHVKACLAGCPQISEMDAVAYMAHFVCHRDMRAVLYDQIREWSQEGRHALLAQHVHAMLCQFNKQ